MTGLDWFGSLIFFKKNIFHLVFLRLFLLFSLEKGPLAGTELCDAEENYWLAWFYFHGL